MYIYIYICMYVCMYVCMHVYIYIYMAVRKVRAEKENCARALEFAGFQLDSLSVSPPAVARWVPNSAAVSAGAGLLGMGAVLRPIDAVAHGCGHRLRRA